MSNHPAFEMVEVQPGRHLHAHVEGPIGAPFVLCDAGAFGIYADCWRLQQVLKRDFRVCIYDRAGMGASDPVPQCDLPSPDWHVEDMRRLLAALNVETPFLLVGHSMSGLRVHAYANMYPDELLGIILVDALSPRQLTESHGKFLGKQFGWLLTAGAYAAAKGLAKPVSVLAPNNFGLDGQMRADKTWSYGAPSHFQAARNEVLAVDEQAAYLHGEGYLSLPLAILSATLICGMKQEDAERAQANTGFGYFEKRPKDDHVSVLLGAGAERISYYAREIIAHCQQ